MIQYRDPSGKVGAEKVIDQIYVSQEALTRAFGGIPEAVEVIVRKVR